VLTFITYVVFIIIVTTQQKTFTLVLSQHNSNICRVVTT